MAKSWTLDALRNPKMRAQAEAQIESESAQGAQEAAKKTRRVIYLPIALGNGNQGRVTRHWGASAKRRKEYENIITAKYGRLIPPPFKQRVIITRILGKGERLLDPDSVLRGSAKELLDALVACGFAQDDSPKWLVSVDGRQDDTRRSDGPSVKIELWETNDDR